MDDKELERLAQEELLQEAKRAQIRAEEMGPTGWQRCPLPATNKRFLRNVLVSTLEPRKKKPRKADTRHCGTKEKDHKPLHRERESKTAAKHQHKNKDTRKHKSQQTSSRTSEHKQKAQTAHYFHQTSRRRIKQQKLI